MYLLKNDEHNKCNNLIESVPFFHECIWIGKAKKSLSSVKTKENVLNAEEVCRAVKRIQKLRFKHERCKVIC